MRSFSGTNVFPVTTSLHQGPVLSPCIFSLIMNKFAAIIQGVIPWCILFVDDTVLNDEKRTELNGK